MEEFEKELEALTLRGPSAGLDARVRAVLVGAAAMKPAAMDPVRHPPAWRAVSTRWALAAALLMGLLGFLAGRLFGPGRVGSAPLAAGEGSASPAVTVHVVYEGRAANPFDCTVAADDGLRRLKDIKIESKSGV
jgi:hypothetical protein